MDLVRRLFGSRGRGTGGDAPPAPVPGESGLAVTEADPPGPPAAIETAGLPCPSCGTLLDPPPPRNRLCPRCREPIVVRRIDGRTALLTESAVQVFEAERRRGSDEASWTAARDGWLGLARDRGASPARRDRLASARISADVVRKSRDLYLSAAEKSVRDATRERRWGEVGHIRREQAAALYRDAGAPVPPPDEIVGLHRAGMIAVLRSLTPAVRQAELVSPGCCPACRKDDGAVFRIADEVRRGRLPHAGCPKGLCGCDWWPAAVEPVRRRRRSATAGPGRSVGAP
jgi:hypothetical protein